MKKTLTANISGTVFHMEEDAYDRLQRYLSTIRLQFAGGSGGDEIMMDIESRIAELFTERMAGRRQVVLMADVEHVEQVMGRPEEYGGGEAGEATGSGSTSHSTSRGRSQKRLFRDPDDRWLGGVLSGIAAYVGTEVLWLRIAFILLVVLGIGTPIFIYVLLWILVPPATSAADRLMMEGEPVTVDNLKKAFEEGSERFAKEAEELGQRWSRSEHWRKAEDRVRTGARSAAGSVGSVLSKTVGLFLILLGSALGIAFLGALIGGGTLTMDSYSGQHSADLLELGGLVFASNGQALWFLGALTVLLLIPVIGLLSAGLELVLGMRAPRWLGWTLAPIWIASIVVIGIIGLRLANDMKRGEPLRTEVTLQQPTGTVLNLGTLGDSLSTQHWSVSYKRGRVNWEFDGLVTSDDTVQGAWARLDVRRSPDSDYHLIVERRARGRSTKGSMYRAANINYQIEHGDGQLSFSPWLRFHKENKLRFQELKFVVQVPEGKSIHLSQDIGFMLDNVRNVNGTLDRDMVGRTWTMTSKGLSSAPAVEPAKPAEAPASEQTAMPARISMNNGSKGPLMILPCLFTVLRPNT